MIYIISILFPFLLVSVINSQYSIIQSQHYEINKYFMYEYKKKILFHALSIVLFVFGLLAKDNIAYILTIISFILVNIFFINKEKLKITKRIKRFFLVYFIMCYLSFFLFDNYIAILLLNCFILEYLFIVHSISIFIENIIRNYYKRQAKKIIKDINIIGITGSYGKTSCKNMIYDMLSVICNVSKTPKSYNTEIGIIKSIRENVDKFDEYFICEYGVDRINGMNKLLKIAKPNVSLITEIGSQHLLTFKNIDNIRKEKLKLAKVLKNNEVAVINNDNVYLKESIDELKCKVITYGINNSSDIMAKNIEISTSGSKFDLYIDNKKIDRISIGLLGEHNVKNVLGAIGVLKAINIKLDDISKLVSYVKPIEHRLQLKAINGIKVIDDSFNSNEEGFKKAIDVLNLMKEKKIVITPGIIEQGGNSNHLNFMLGEYMVGKVDEVVLVEKNALVIKEGLLSKGFDEDKIIMKKNFMKAWEYVKEIHEDKIVLIENDLPSIYLK